MKLPELSFPRIGAVLVKEFVEMRRDRMTFAILISIPVIQLILFGYAINLDPKHLPTVLISEEATPIVRSIEKAFENSGYYDIIEHRTDPRQVDPILKSGHASFVVIIPAGFTERFLRGERPQILVEADATDPSAASNALSRAPEVILSGLAPHMKGPLAYLAPAAPPVDVVIHPRFNPEANTQYNIVPGLLGIILTMTLVLVTSMAMTRETERGNLENLLAMPVTPMEMMAGKITPYIGIGLLQAAIVMIAARYLFAVPFVGDLSILTIGILVFIVSNLAVGFTFSTLAESQLQAMQLTIFYFLPNILISGFMFPYEGMPGWAQFISETLPLTHLLRIVRGVMLKESGWADLGYDFAAMGVFTTLAVAAALIRYRRTLD